MSKTILITGATDGIGFATAKQLVAAGHHVLLHGRNTSKLDNVKQELARSNDKGQIETYVADLSTLQEVKALAMEIKKNHNKIDVLINNAGVYVSKQNVTDDGLDTRFVVNTVAPYLLTKLLLPILVKGSRIINLSSAAQAPLNPNNLTTTSKQSDAIVYAQSKLALTMWSISMANTLKDNQIVVIAVNPGSMLGSKMVKEAYGVNGKDIQIGACILSDLALSDQYKNNSGQYFDNDSGKFARPHPDALDTQKNQQVVNVIEAMLVNTLQ